MNESLRVITVPSNFVTLRSPRRGIAIPEELAIVGFDDSEIAEHLGLTSVRQPLEESGEVATETLLAEMSNPGRTQQHISLKLSVVERDTT